MPCGGLRSGGGNRGADPRGLNLVSGPALFEHPKDRDCDLTTGRASHVLGP